MNSSYSLNFVIPQGPTGPTGPIGAANGLNAYGGRYNSTGGNISLGIATQSQIPLANTMPNLNTSYATANSITVNQSGIYEINYFTNISVTVGTTVTLAVRQNGSNIPATVVTRALSLGTSSIYSGSVIVSLTAGSVIDMAISALVSVSATLGSGNSANLTVKKLN